MASASASFHISVHPLHISFISLAHSSWTSWHTTKHWKHCHGIALSDIWKSMIPSQGGWSSNLGALYSTTLAWDHILWLPEFDNGIWWHRLNTAPGFRADRVPCEWIVSYHIGEAKEWPFVLRILGRTGSNTKHRKQKATRSSCQCCVFHICGVTCDNMFLGAQKISGL